MTKFGSNSNGAIWWPNLQPIQVVPLKSILNYSSWNIYSSLMKSIPWVRCAMFLQWSIFVQIRQAWVPLRGWWLHWEGGGARHYKDNCNWLSMMVMIGVNVCVIEVCNGRSLSRGQCEDGSDEEVECCLQQVAFHFFLSWTTVTKLNNQRENLE